MQPLDSAAVYSILHNSWILFMKIPEKSLGNNKAKYFFSNTDHYWIDFSAHLEKHQRSPKRTYIEPEQRSVDSSTTWPSECACSNAGKRVIDFSHRNDPKRTCIEPEQRSVDFGKSSPSKCASIEAEITRLSLWWTLKQDLNWGSIIN